MNFSLEIIGFTIDGCRIAQNAGARRVELCANPAEGGTSPSYGFIKAARKLLHIDLYPMIHPRGGHFFYTDEEFEIVKSDVKLCKNMGCDGVAIGVLTKDGKVDKKRCSTLAELAYPLGVTFHRAFDRTADPFKALEDIIDIGCERILTSGQKPTAAEGAQLIKELNTKAEGRIIIMPGAGIRANNIAQIAETTGAVEFHSSARIHAPGSMTFINPSMKESNDLISVDENEVKKMQYELSFINDSKAQTL